MIGLLPPVGDSARFYRLEPLRLGYRILSSRAEAEGKAQEDLLGSVALYQQGRLDGPT